MKKIHLIVAHDPNGAIGFQGDMPWPRNSIDLQSFRQVTTTTHDPTKVNAVIMGYRTYASIGRPLPKRVNIVVTRDHYVAGDDRDNNDRQLIFVKSPKEALECASACEQVEACFVIGGFRIYESLMDCCDSLYLTRMKSVAAQADTFIPLDRIENAISQGIFMLQRSEERGDHVFQHYVKQTQATRSPLNP